MTNEKDISAARQMVEICVNAEFAVEDKIRLVAEQFSMVREATETLEAINYRLSLQNEALKAQLSGKPHLPKAGEVGGSETLRDSKMQAIARIVHSSLPDHLGFIVIVAPMKSDASKMVECGYVSNVRKEDAISALKTLLFRWGVNGEWMKKV